MAPARAPARAALRLAARHAIVLSREPGQPFGRRAHQARVRSAAGARAAVAVHQRANCARRPRACAGFVHGLRARLRHRTASLRTGTSPCRRARSTMPAASSPTDGRRCSSAPAPAMRRAIGRPSATPRSPIMPPRCIACASCWWEAAAPRRRGWAPRSRAAARTPLINQIGKDTLPQLLGPDVAKHRAAVAGFGSRAHGRHGRIAGHRSVCRHQSAARRTLLQPPVVRRQVRRGGAQVPGQARGANSLDDENRAAAASWT